MKYTSLLCSTLLLLLLFLLFNCQDDIGEEIKSRQARMTEISEMVNDLIEDKSCNGVDDCASIAYGAKPCGGPWGYLVYAPSNVDVAELEQLVEEYNQLEEEINQISGRVSDCGLVEEPDLECADNICAIKN